VLEARAQEMMEIIAGKLTESGFIDRLPAGIVLTGGCSQLPGFAELGRSELSMPVRVGAAQSALPISGLTRTLMTPGYATSVGLLLWGLHEDARAVHRRFEADHGGSSSQKWMGAAAKWLKTLLPDRD
jgi:cell division protein FtsA